ncbi:MAG: acyl-CoA thioesterase [Deltaproteobacteria bacterium]|nr:acyl-CoA thioesterase [Deltaproteobacteria bacterium]
MAIRRRPSDSAVEATHLVLPPDTNTHGTAFGGRILQWMDIAAGIAANRHCGGPVVTAAVDDLHFARPIRMGDVVIVRASVNHTGHSSMEVGVRVEREEANTRHREHCLSGYFIFVAVDDNRNPATVPPVTPATADEKRRFKNAIRRRERRLAQRSA